MPRPPQDRVKVNVYLQGRVLAGLKKIAQIKGTSYSELVRLACHEYVVREGKRVLQEQQQINAMAPAPRAQVTNDDADPRERG